MSESRGGILPDLYPVQGTITLDCALFPREVLDHMMSVPGFQPVLKIEVPLAFVQGGATLTVDSQQSLLEFEFAAIDIKLEEAKIDG